MQIKKSQLERLIKIAILDILRELQGRAQEAGLTEGVFGKVKDFVDGGPDPYEERDKEDKRNRAAAQAKDAEFDKTHPHGFVPKPTPSPKPNVPQQPRWKDWD